MIPRETLAALRFGTGLPQPAGAPAPEGLVAALAGPDAGAARYPIPGAAAVAPLLARAYAARRTVRKDKAGNDTADDQALKAARDALRAAELGAARAMLARAVDAPDPFRERLVRFWADHFTVLARRAYDGPLVPAFAEDAIRPHVAGRFADLLRAATLHPAMLVSLDQTSSVGPGSRAGQRRGAGLNENLARELIELHTLGVAAAYSQADVRELAELLTGLSVDDGGFVFLPGRAEPGAETVLGRTYDGRGLAPVLAVLDDLAARPETAAHIARKLAVHFVADDPDPSLVAAMEAAFAGSGGDLPQVYAAMLDHPAAWDGALSKARQPFDVIAAALKALGFDGAAVLALGDGVFRKRLLLPMQAMGQPLGRPRGPDGWPEAAEAWITPQALAARIGWAMVQPARLLRDLPDPVALARRGLGEAADERLLWAAARAETRDQGVGLVLSSPAFNRR